MIDYGANVNGQVLEARKFKCFRDWFSKMHREREEEETKGVVSKIKCSHGKKSS